MPFPVDVRWITDTERKLGVRFPASFVTAMVEIGAGGGSIARLVEGNAIRVGPQSAGANPGPASYRRGGPLAVTDANVMLGKIQPHHFPQVFGPNADAPLDRAAVEKKFDALATPEAARVQAFESEGGGSRATYFRCKNELLARRGAFKTSEVAAIKLGPVKPDLHYLALLERRQQIEQMRGCDERDR